MFLLMFLGQSGSPKGWKISRRTLSCKKTLPALLYVMETQFNDETLADTFLTKVSVSSL